MLAHEAVRATTSAPTFYAPAVIGTQRMVDGAILANNPTLVGLAEAALLWPGAPVDVLLSLGTGTQVPRPSGAAGNVMGWVRTVVELSMNSFMTHKAVSTLLAARLALDMDADDGAADGPLAAGAPPARRGGRRPRVYWRLDPDGCGDVDISESRLDVIARMLGEGRRYVQRQAPAIAELAAALGGRLGSPAGPRVA